MKIEWAAMGLAIALLMPANALAECSIEQRIDLAKAGYDKGEVDALCAQSQTTTAQPAPRSSLEVLQAATYDVPTEKRLLKIYGPESKCEFLEYAVRMRRNGAKERPYSELISGKSQRSYVFYADRKKGFISAHIMVMKPEISGYDICYAMVVRRTGVSADEFDALAADLEREFNAVKAALAERGVRGLE